MSAVVGQLSIISCQLSDCIFCKIVNKEQSADIVYENDKVIAFSDINPKAPVHVLIVPKKHIATMKDMQDGDLELLAGILMASKEIAKIKKIDEGYKLVFNVGRKGGQIIDHVHLHLLGGWK